MTAPDMLRFLVNVGCPEPDDVAAVAALRSWFELGLSTVASGYVRMLAGQPPLPTLWEDAQPGTAWGDLEYGVPNRHGRRRTVREPYSDRALAAFRDRAGDILAISTSRFDAMLTIGIHGGGYPYQHADSVEIIAGRDMPAAGVLTMQIGFPIKRLEADMLPRWCGWLDEHEATFGLVEANHPYPETAFELQTPRRYCDDSGTFLDDSLRSTRSRLRGYGWLTIAAREIGDRLGGAQALRAAGAFVAVAQARSGSYWLQATEHPTEYGMAEAERVFRAVAPALPPGLPRTPRPPTRGEYPRLVVVQDPARLTH